MPATAPRIALTFGDFSGIGPELAVRLLAEPGNLDKAQVLALVSQEEFDRACDAAGVTVPTADEPSIGAVHLVGSSRQDIAVPSATISVDAGMRVMQDLEKALTMFKEGQVDSIMFLPLNKTSLHLAGMNEEDELRWFAKELGFDGFTSELNFVPGLTTSRVTSHIPISEVAHHISAGRVRQAIKLLHRVVLGAGVEKPRIAVAALNPHAGENGQFGREEIDHIAPGVELAREVDGIDVKGPYPSDTLFIKARDGEFDGVVTMYHDQGQIAVKLLGFDKGVTVQGGLPVPIATPAHGTAYEIVGLNKAHLGPSQRAFDISVGLGIQTAESRSA
ncbi:4-hydroxythreonine-4-phosphate dehydrogenase PdxA [Brachybacterium sp. AOP29-B2-41]|uniref:4-hydroxythreonine-4-phosphate dehydrogenase PdxA n=1 Tax=Brachybacterium sp. AOP29-B2-41 TaxID=3457704 RepID=UPI0040340417